MFQDTIQYFILSSILLVSLAISLRHLFPQLTGLYLDKLANLLLQPQRAAVFHFAGKRLRLNQLKAGSCGSSGCSSCQACGQALSQNDGDGEQILSVKINTSGN
ncbi:DUF6587 family protein [Zhongshania aquimaris]|uniref:Uncharacterized protein n=1 Tax=Zhongshania aquimaris TaxID=2857107 RepID=A0ABS6VU36_9GAMM|nr:DUF6587 family protein [Zhongshania aquimaris]MBW2941826.1 hypothetical protein [Zhongshania aquimaris]